MVPPTPVLWGVEMVQTLVKIINIGLHPLPIIPQNMNRVDLRHFLGVLLPPDLS